MLSLIQLVNFPPLGDDRGALVAIESHKTVPFDIKRVYYIFGTQFGVSRGFHAHRALQQVAVCVTGKCRMVLDDGQRREEVWLNSPTKGWLVINSTMFRHVKTLYNPKNLGTCASVNNMITHMVAGRCKLTAGDDVYSFENIFELTAFAPDTAMVSGRALYLLDDELVEDRIANTLGIPYSRSCLHPSASAQHCSARHAGIHAQMAIVFNFSLVIYNSPAVHYSSNAQ